MNNLSNKLADRTVMSKNIKMVTAAVIIKDGKILITRRGGQGSVPGKWEFPGGKVEQGETLQQCLSRELSEELSIETKVYDVLAESVFEYDHGKFKIIALKAEIVKGDIKLSVHDKYDWVLFDEILSYDLAPADIPLAKLILEKKHEL